MFNYIPKPFRNMPKDHVMLPMRMHRLLVRLNNYMVKENVNKVVQIRWLVLVFDLYKEKVINHISI